MGRIEKYGFVNSAFISFYGLFMGYNRNIKFASQ